jgi:tellurite resistance protein TerA
MHLQQGEKRSLSDLGVANRCTVKIDFGLDGVDIAAFGLNKEQKIGDDRYVVLFSNAEAPDGAIVMIPSSDTAVFNLDLDKLPVSIDRIVFTATHDTKSIAEARPLIVTLDGVKASFNVAERLTNEKAVMMIEIYRHSSGWKIGTIAAGFAGGLSALISHFGGEVADAAPPPRPSASPPPSPPPPPAAPVSLKKITLEKSSPTVSLKKTGSSFGEIVLNLNWNQIEQKKGFLASLAGAKKLDLDLGVLFEFHDGFKGCIQALGNTFGSFHSEPFIELSGDDRTGAVAAGETIRVNGQYFDRIKRLGIFALIYEGAPNWQETDGVVKMNIPGQPEIEVRMNEGQNSRRLCGIATIDNVGGELQMKRHMQYYPSQKGFADDIGIMLRWEAGTKD